MYSLPSEYEILNQPTQQYTIIYISLFISVTYILYNVQPKMAYKSLQIQKYILYILNIYYVESLLA